MKIPDTLFPGWTSSHSSGTGGQPCRKTFLSFCLIVVAAAFFQNNGAAATLEWTGSSGSNWTDAANWAITSGSDADGIPDADDDVIFPSNAVYSSGVNLNGAQACRSVLYSNLASFTLGPAGQTLTIESGRFTRQNIGGTGPQHTIACDLYLNAPDGSNVFDVAGYEDYTNPDRHVIVQGRITAPGMLVKTGINGKLTLANTNSFGGPPVIETGTLEIRSQLVTNAIGSGRIEMGSGSRLYVRTKSQTLVNPISITASGTNPIIASYSCTLTLLGDIDVPAGRTVQFGHSGSSLLILSNNLSGTGSIIINRSGTCFRGTNQFLTGNINIGSAGGNIILDNISWTTFTNWYYLGYGTENRQWQLGGGFAARGAPLVIEGSGTPGGGANAKTWFNRSIGFGGTYDDATRMYADAPVTVRVHTELSGRVDWSSASASGPGLNGTHREGVLNRFEANIIDQVSAGTGTNRGAMRFVGWYGNDEIVLAGTNDWRGSYCARDLYVGGSGTNSLNSGPGGIQTHNSAGKTMLIQFDGNESLPRGNGGQTSYLAAVSRYSGWQGFLFAAKAGGETYALRPGYKFVLGCNNGGTIGILGATGPSNSTAVLENSAACCHAAGLTDTGIVELVARGPSEFILGTPGTGTNGALLFQPSYGFDPTNYDSGVAGAASVLTNSTAPRWLRTRGDGTVVLRHVEYTQLDGSGDTHNQFIWYLGLASGSTYFDGALRETGAELWNSTTGFPLFIQGGVLELGGGDFQRLVRSSPAAGQVSLYYGGGFSAFGADRRVNLNTNNIFDWGNTTGGYTHNNQPLLFGSRTANATVIFENDISLGSSGTRIMGSVRGTGQGPEVRITGCITNAGSLRIIAPTTRAGEPLPGGVIEWAHPTNTMTGSISIEGGTLMVNGGIRSGSAYVTVTNGGALAGTGIVIRPVLVTSGGTLAPGTTTNAGTLTIQGSVVFGEGAVFRAMGGLVLVSGTLTLPTNATVILQSPQLGAIFTATSLAGASDLNAWTVANARNIKARVAGNSVILAQSGGTVFVVH